MEPAKEILDLVDPTNLDDPMAAVAVCYRCVTSVGSEEPLRDIQLCRSESCTVWESRRKAMEKIGPKKGGVDRDSGR